MEDELLFSSSPVLEAVESSTVVSSPYGNAADTSAMLMSSFAVAARGGERLKGDLGSTGTNNCVF